jgi:hypothetical protein
MLPAVPGLGIEAALTLLGARGATEPESPSTGSNSDIVYSPGTTPPEALEPEPFKFPEGTEDGSGNIVRPPIISPLI